MINPNTKGLKGWAEQDFPKLSNYFFRHSGYPALDLRTAPHAFGCTPPEPRTGTCTFRPRPGRAPGNSAPRKP